MGENRESIRVMGFIGRHRRSALAQRLAFFTCLAVLLLLPSAAFAAEEETHLFDATLSLTGDCTTATIDPVPDPGCPEGAHPPKPFNKHGVVAVDPYGDRYVLSAGGSTSGSEGRIDIFGPTGKFIAQLPVAIPFDGTEGPLASLAVDSEGYLYVSSLSSEQSAPRPFDLFRYTPTEYNHAAGEIAYDTPPAAIPVPSVFGNGPNWLDLPRLVVDPSNDHLYVARSGSFDLLEYGSAAEGNPFLTGVRLEGTKEYGRWIRAWALDSVRKRIVVADVIEVGGQGRSVVKVFDQEGSSDPLEPHQLLFTIDGSTTPTERFVSETRYLPLAVDEATGHIFVGDLNAPTRRVYEFDGDGEPVSTIEAGFKSTTSGQLQMAYDDSPTSPTEGYLFVPSHNGPGRSLAFAPKPDTAPPLVEGLSATAITSSEAILRGKVNPKVLQTGYRIEYTTEGAFQAEGFAGAALAGEGSLDPVGEALEVSAPAAGLLPGTAYRFRIVAENELGEGEAEASFATYSLPSVSSDCANQSLRAGPSAALPDCRAYELVTPADTNGHPPYGNKNVTPLFPSRLSSPNGNRLSFQVEGGGLPGIGATGSYGGDPYRASRGAGGWQTEFTGPSPAFAVGIRPGSSSPDQSHVLWRSTGPGPASLEGIDTTYVRYPDGHSEPAGQGSLATDPGAEVKLISGNASHIILQTHAPGGTFSTGRQLEPGAAPDGTDAIYDRTADGTLHVVSLLPGEITPAAGQKAFFKGASLDGKGVAFQIGATLYLRHRDEATYAVGEGLTFVSVAEGGDRLFYMQGGDLYAYDASSETATPFTESGDVTPVNIAAGGTSAYFVSPSELGGANPEGDFAQPGEQNLYRSHEGQVSFLGTVSQRDVEGVVMPATDTIRGLGLWIEALAPTWAAFAVDPSRTTADGGVLLFESNADLTGHDPQGHTQVYRYDAAAETLACLSCNPTGTSSGEAALQSLNIGELLLTNWNPVENLSADGRRAFFESTEALVASDTDGRRDVYQWEEDSVGDCHDPGGCVSLISSGNSGRDDYLYAVSDSGDDVFFRTSDLLAGGDSDETPSIYDARVNGGFPPPQSPAGECLGEACQPAALAPDDPTPASASVQGAGNVTEERQRCPKGKRAVRRSGKRRCVALKHKKVHSKSHRRKKHANNNRRAGR